MRTEYFIEGTQPVEQCQLHGGGGMRVAGWETGQPARSGEQNSPLAGGAQQQRVARTGQPPTPESPSLPQPPPKRKGFFERLRGIFR